MKSKKIGRRTLLRGSLGAMGVALGLPTLEAFCNSHGTAYADGSAFPTRLGLFFWGNGVLPPKWVPELAGEGDAWQLSEQLSPLAHVKSKLGVVSRTAVGLPNAKAHSSGLCGVLAGSAAVPMGPEGNAYLPTGPSFDQVAAEQWAGLTPHTYLCFGAAPGGRDASVSFTGSGSKNPFVSSPREFFMQVFGDSYRPPGVEPMIDPRWGLRRSVLDTVGEQMVALQSRVGRQDQVRLEEHFEGIRAIETRLAGLEETPVALAACGVPPMPGDDLPEIEGRPQLSALNRLHCDILTMALACDQTRIFNNMFTSPVSSPLFAAPWPPGARDLAGRRPLGKYRDFRATMGHHRLTHDEPGDQPQVNVIVQMIMEEFAYLIQKLDSVQEGAEGTLLDHSVVLGTTDCSNCRTHSLDNYPIAYAGSANGKLRTDIHHAANPGENTSKVIFSILRAAGVRVSEFGRDGGRVTEGMPAIENAMM